MHVAGMAVCVWLNVRTWQAGICQLSDLIVSPCLFADMFTQ
jgi:hypothetical protein